MRAGKQDKAKHLLYIRRLHGPDFWVLAWNPKWSALFFASLDALGVGVGVTNLATCAERVPRVVLHPIMILATECG